MTLLKVEDLTIKFKSRQGVVKAVDNLNFELAQGSSLGIVGESGSGKSVTSLTIMGLLQNANTEITGSIDFDGLDLLKLSPREMRKIRGNSISMIFQEPMTSLNPLHTCGKQIMEPILIHQKDVSKQEAKKQAIELLRMVGIPSPEQRFHEYPHQMSGGMRQRIMIAIALACNTKLLIADEPTTALDVTIQAQILDLMSSLKKKRNMSIIMITHDLGVVKEMCEKVVVMYTGQIVEKSPTELVFADPLHPYTKGLLNAIPRISSKVERLEAIEGSVPDALNMPRGCSFHPRCKFATEKCKLESPPLFQLEDGREVKCFIYDGSERGGDVNGTK
ncbi:ABC transporter ATP-binding protein [Lysinibacillus pakistanensis]|uniref:ABC transporter ATP-binding protein n=1 Tax=Lysinibacillus pakistanensis TaxID=759811 RepID=A0AAX3X271_9BACI|nr:ABC transporter ATP-binding protein [Lysinibacillus pakistanensis]MDM5233253.1 ABC transporter ATP-binding protein [Lysinibacillus pakistanensis]WHY48731.1 ABC transporter ATP-binding protein [Lysinibacillus pakistanensis]WHY53744.1 ABC transporter ATP-binding protein [Lysinibacillus pakistanensis]